MAKNPPVHLRFVRLRPLLSWIVPYGYGLAFDVASYYLGCGPCSLLVQGTVPNAVPKSKYSSYERWRFMTCD